MLQKLTKEEQRKLSSSISCMFELLHAPSTTYQQREIPAPKEGYKIAFFPASMFTFGDCFLSDDDDDFVPAEDAKISKLFSGLCEKPFIWRFKWDTLYNCPISVSKNIIFEGKCETFDQARIYIHDDPAFGESYGLYYPDNKIIIGSEHEFSFGFSISELSFYKKIISIFGGEKCLQEDLYQKAKNGYFDSSDREWAARYIKLNL